MQIIVNNLIVDATPELVAEMFADFGSDEQARFFNQVAEIASDWSFPMQLQAITEENGLSIKGRHVMQSIGDYSHWGLSCTLARDIAGGE